MDICGGNTAHEEINDLIEKVNDQEEAMEKLNDKIIELESNQKEN